MYRLALFPLPVVLLPEDRLPLHIFEPRYRRMVARCLEYDRRFGLVYHDPDRRGPFLSEEGRVGCVAEIERFEPLPDGRSVILTSGVERFTIRDGIESEEPFYEAVVEPYEDREADEDDLRSRRRRTLELFREAVASLADGEEGDEEPSGVPDLGTDAELSFPLAATLRIAPSWKQAFLERLDAIFQAAARDDR